MNGAFCNALAFCFGLEEIDISGDKNVGDEGLSALYKGDIKIEGG